MIAPIILFFLIVGVASIFFELRYRRPLWRTISYITLMVISFVMVAIAYRQIVPLATADRLELRGQYFPLDGHVRISGDPSIADYYAPELMLRGEDQAIRENPLIEGSSYDNNTAFQAVGNGLARPLALNGEILNQRLISRQNVIDVGALKMTCTRNLSLPFPLLLALPFLALLAILCKFKLKRAGLRLFSYCILLLIGVIAVAVGYRHFASGQFIINGQEYSGDWPRQGAVTSMGELLCRAGVSHEDQYVNIYPASTSSTAPAQENRPARDNPLDRLFVISQSWLSVGLVNGSSEVVRINGEELQPQVRFVLRTGDQLTYGHGRHPLKLKVSIETGDNRIYFLPENPLRFPLYHSSEENESPESKVFISSAPTTASPAYQFSLGERNRDLVKGMIQYSLSGEIAESDPTDRTDEEKQEFRENYRQGFIVNSGTDLRSYKWGETAALGSSRGGVLVSLNRKEVMSLRPVLEILVIWVLSAVFFTTFGWIAKQNYLFVLMPLVQMLLAFRLVLSYRGYLLPPNLTTSYEKALFAAIFVPFAIFLWLYSKQISEALDFGSRHLTYQRGLFGTAVLDALRQLLLLPPTLYLVVSSLLMWAVGVFSTSFAPLGITIGFFVVALLISKFLANRVLSMPGKLPLEVFIEEGFQQTHGAGIISRIRAFLRLWRLPDLHVWVLLLTPILMALALKVSVGKTEELPFIPIRSEVFYQPCLFLGACRFYMWFFREFSGGIGRTISSWQYPWLLVPPAAYFVQAAVVGDWGFCVYAVPILVLALIICWRSSYRIAFTVIGSIILVLYLFFGTSLFTNTVASILPDDSTVAYRYLAYRSAGYLEEAAIDATDKSHSTAAACRAGSSAARRIFEIHEHFWTMFHFAARGPSGVGYGSAPIERVSFPDGIAQSDNTYSIYILAEHGSRGGIAILTVYLVLALLMAFILTQHFGDQPAPTLLIAGGAMLVVFSALYHAGGNVSTVPFTGKNLPLLSLNSYSDVVQVAFLLALAFSVIGHNLEDLPASNIGILGAFRGGGNALNKWLAAISLALALCFGGVAASSVRAAGNEAFRQDYDMSRFVDTTKEYVEKGTISLNLQDLTINLDSDKVRGLGAGQYLRSLRDQFNNASTEEKESGKYFFMARNLVQDEDIYGSGDKPRDRHRNTVLTVDENYFKRISPFATKVFWNGGLRSSDSDEPAQGYLSGEGLSLFLRHVIGSENPIPGLGDRRKVKVLKPEDRTSTGKQFTSRLFIVTNDQQEELFSLSAIEGDAVLEPIASSAVVNGQPVRGKTRLEPGDIVAIKRSQPRAGGRDLVFIYQRSQSGLLGHHQWVNGSQQYAYPQGEAFALARPIVEAVNAHIGQMNQEGQVGQAGEAANRPLVLSINIDLNRKIYDKLVEEGNKLWLEINGKNGLPPRLAVTALNPQTGEVSALASWPSFDPNPFPAAQEKTDPRSYTNLMRRRDPGSVRILRNHNFTRHVLGSATKPFIAAASASSYHELLGLEVDDVQNAYSKVLGIPTEPAWECHNKGAPGLVSWDQFLVQSNNLYAVTIGFLGLASSDRDGGMQFVSKNNPQQIWIGGQQQDHQPDFGDRLGGKTGESINLDRTRLASKLEQLFEIQISGPDANPITQVWRGAQQSHLLPERIAPLTFISPEMPNLALNRIQNARDFVSICLGGKTNLWSNVKSAEAFARLVTGRRISASLVRADQPSQFEPMDPSYAAVQPALLRALEGVSLRGTASNLAPFISRINGGLGARGAGQYFTIFSKTGTLEGQYKSVRDDSNLIMAAGIWDPATRSLSNGTVLSIYIEKGGKGRAALFAGRLMELLNKQFGWARSVTFEDEDH